MEDIKISEDGTEATMIIRNYALHPSLLGLPLPAMRSAFCRNIHGGENYRDAGRSTYSPHQGSKERLKRMKRLERKD